MVEKSRKKRKKRRVIIGLAIFLFLIVAVLVLSIPTVCSFWSVSEYDHLSAEFIDEIEQLDSQVIECIRENDTEKFNELSSLYYMAKIRPIKGISLNDLHEKIGDNEYTYIQINHAIYQGYTLFYTRALATGSPLYDNRFVLYIGSVGKEQVASLVYFERENIDVLLATHYTKQSDKWILYAVNAVEFKYDDKDYVDYYNIAEVFYRRSHHVSSYIFAKMGKRIEDVEGALLQRKSYSYNLDGLYDELSEYLCKGDEIPLEFGNVEVYEFEIDYQEVSLRPVIRYTTDIEITPENYTAIEQQIKSLHGEIAEYYKIDEDFNTFIYEATDGDAVHRTVVGE